MYTSPMPFDWLEPRVGEVVRRREPERTMEAHRREITDRAAVLMRLGYDAAHAEGRCRRNVEWEFELQRRPAVAEEIDTLVRSVFARR